MVSFRTIATAALAAFSVPVFGAITGAEMVVNIKTLTDKSLAIQAPANELSLVNAPLLIIGQGPFPKVILGFADIIATTTTAVAQMQGSAEIGAGAEADAIFDAFREFVRVHQVLLNILIGKGNIVSQIPIFGAPVAAILRQLEAIVDTVAFMLIDTVQGRSQDLQTEAGKLTGSITVAIDTYSNINIAGVKLGLPALDLASLGLDLANLNVDFTTLTLGLSNLDLSNLKIALSKSGLANLNAGLSNLSLTLSNLNLGINLNLGLVKGETRAQRAARAIAASA